MKIGNKLNKIDFIPPWRKIRIQLDVSIQSVLRDKRLFDESIYED